MFFNKFYLFLFLYLICFWGRADSGEIKVSVVVSEPPCSISSSPIEFGYINKNHVNGDEFKKTIEYDIKCGNNDAGYNLLMKLTGEGVDFDNNNSTINTNIDGLGIRILENESPFFLDKAISFNSFELPILQAFPVKKDGVDLPVGEFHATATLTISYP